MNYKVKKFKKGYLTKHSDKWWKIDGGDQQSWRSSTCPSMTHGVVNWFPNYGKTDYTKQLKKQIEAGVQVEIALPSELLC